MMNWDTFNTSLASARATLLAAAPDGATAAEAEAYLMRLTSSALNDAFLSQHFSRDGLTRSLPTRGGPNPDFLMCHAAIDSTRRYRLEGCLNDSERVGIGLYSFSANGVALLAGYRAFDRKSAVAEGRFTLEIAADAKGPRVLAIPSEARVLLIRTLHRNPHGYPAALTLTGGSESRGLAIEGTDLALTQAARSVLGGVHQFMVWSRLTSASANQFIAPPPDIAEAVRGDPDITYYLGYYALDDGECLEVSVPAVSGYWSLHAYTHWLESLPGAGVHDLNAQPECDGSFRVRIGPSIPSETRNRIDTLGRERGVLIFRTIGTPHIPVPQTRLYRRTEI